MAQGLHTPYQGSGESYYQAQTSPEYWQTPYLQDANSGYQYYAGYGQQRAHLQPAARTSNLMHPGQTPTRAIDQFVEEQCQQGQPGEHAGEDPGVQNTGEKK
jgi:hypothetical protein